MGHCRLRVIELETARSLMHKYRQNQKLSRDDDKLQVFADIFGREESGPDHACKAFQEAVQEFTAVGEQVASP